MRIRIKSKPPVEQIHELDVGKEFDVIPTPDEYSHLSTGIWIEGATGKPVRIFRTEYEVINERT